VFADSCGLGARVVERLLARGDRVVTVVPGPRFERRRGGDYAVRPAEVADYEALLDDLAEGGGRPGRIAHLWGVTARDGAPLTLEHRQDHGFYSLLFLAQALGSRNADGEVALTVVTSGLAEVSGEGRLDPEKATVLGPCRVIPQEYPGLSCRNVDVRVAEHGTWPDEQIDWLLAECNDRAGEPIVAYRGRERWVQALEAVRLEAREPRRGRLRDRGVYLITGGLGGIGLELAGFLADTVRARLVLVSRSPLPARGDWDAWVDRAGEADPTSRKVRKLAALEARGAEVLVIRADVADRRDMRDALARAEARFGAIHGVIHAAGVAPGGVIQLKTREMAEGVLRPKVAGTLALLELLRERRPDFVLLCSSLASILGVPGQSDYCAANAFQDAVARSRADADGPFILSLNWDAWLEVGMAVDGGGRPVLPEGRRAALAGDGGILSREGIEAFVRALHQPFPQLLVSTVALAPRLARHRALNELPPVTAAREAPSRHPRPALAVPYVGPRDEVEQAVADIWQDLLGLEQVGMDDDFFDLGGHSLLAMQVVNQVRQTFGLPLKLQALFDAPTVAELSRVIVGHEARPGEAREIARITREVARLPGEEVERLLREEGAAGGNA